MFFFCALLGAVVGTTIQMQDLFVSGKASGLPWVADGTDLVYRIPSLVATNSTLIAFASERMSGKGDESPTNLVQRTSRDGGATWGALTLVVKSHLGPVDGFSSAPWSIADRAGEVWLFYNANSTGGETCRCGVAVIKSINGQSWSKPVAIPPSSGMVGSSLASGIKLQKGPHKGRLITCMRKICKNSCPAPYYSFASYSDDDGATWNSSASLHAGTTECQIAELSTGDLYMSIRAYKGLDSHGKRVSSRSTDGGATWSAVKMEEQLVAAGGVAGSVVTEISASASASASRVGADAGALKNRVYYSHPDATGRTNMTVYVSHDDAATWNETVQVYAGGSGYSDMTVLGPGKVGLLFEKDNYKSLSFATVQVD